MHHSAVDYAEFNYRFLDVQRHASLEAPRPGVDRHATGANDSLAECVLELRDLYKNVQLAQSRVHEVPRQFYALTHPLYPGQQGKADLSISMMNRPVAEALENIAGIGRGAPNQNPYLPPPDRSSQSPPPAAAARWAQPATLGARRPGRQSVAAAGGAGNSWSAARVARAAPGRRRPRQHQGGAQGGAQGGEGGAQGGEEARKEAAARKTEKRRSSVAGKRLNLGRKRRRQRQRRGRLGVLC